MGDTKTHVQDVGVGPSIVTRSASGVYKFNKSVQTVRLGAPARNSHMKWSHDRPVYVVLQCACTYSMIISYFMI